MARSLPEVCPFLVSVDLKLKWPELPRPTLLRVYSRPQTLYVCVVGVRVEVVSRARLSHGVARGWPARLVWREGLRTRLLEDVCCVSDIQGYRACMQWAVLMFWFRCQARQGAYVTDILGLGPVVSQGQTHTCGSGPARLWALGEEG